MPLAHPPPVTVKQCQTSPARLTDDIVLARLPPQRLWRRVPLEEHSPYYSILAVLRSDDANPPDDADIWSACLSSTLPVVLSRLSPEQNINTDAFKLHSRRHFSRTKPFRPQCRSHSLREIEAIPHNHMHARPIGGQLNLHVDDGDIDGVKGFVNYSKDWNLRLFVTS